MTHFEGALDFRLFWCGHECVWECVCVFVRVVLYCWRALVQCWAVLEPRQGSKGAIRNLITALNVSLASSPCIGFRFAPALSSPSARRTSISLFVLYLVFPPLFSVGRGKNVSGAFVTSRNNNLDLSPINIVFGSYDCCSVIMSRTSADLMTKVLLRQRTFVMIMKLLLNFLPRTFISWTAFMHSNLSVFHQYYWVKILTIKLASHTSLLPRHFIFFVCLFFCLRTFFIDGCGTFHSPTAMLHKKECWVTIRGVTQMI